MKPSPMKRLFIAVAVLGAMAPASAFNPAMAALSCNLVETHDEWDRRLCRYECDNGRSSVKVERKWMKCTPCRRSFTK